jgi:hypothetical protein
VGIMMKLFKITYEYQTGQWTSGATPSELIVAKDLEDAKNKCREKHPNCEWYGGGEVEVEGYQVFAKYDSVEDSIIEDEIEYIDYFDDVIFNALIDIGKAKAMTVNEIITNEMLADIRGLIVDHIKKATDDAVDLSAPVKIYELQEYKIIFQIDIPVNMSVDIRHENRIELTRKEIIDEALSHMHKINTEIDQYDIIEIKTIIKE